MKREKRYPVDWSRKKIKSELQQISERIQEYNIGETDDVMVHLIKDAVRFNFGNTELQYRKSHWVSWLAITISIMSIGFSVVLYRNQTCFHKVQNDNLEILLSIEDAVNVIANDVDEIRDSLTVTEPNPDYESDSSDSFQTTGLSGKSLSESCDQLIIYAPDRTWTESAQSKKFQP